MQAAFLRVAAVVACPTDCPKVGQHVRTTVPAWLDVVGNGGASLTTEQAKLAAEAVAAQGREPQRLPLVGVVDAACLRWTWRASGPVDADRLVDGRAVWHGYMHAIDTGYAQWCLTYGLHKAHMKAGRAAQ
jgi:hypothetical protein